MKISIIDDDKNDREIIEKTVRTALSSLNMDPDISVFDNAAAFLNEDDNESDLAFVDIDMPEMCGIMLKDEIEKRLWSIRMVYVTSHSERMAEAFGKNVCGFVGKPISTENVERFIKATLNDRKAAKNVSLKAGNRSFVVDKTKIVTVGAEGKYSRITLVSDKTLVDSSINDLEKELCGPTFIRVHRSFIVNLAYVRAISDKIELENGDKIPYSRSQKKYILNSYRKFCEGLM